MKLPEFVFFPCREFCCTETSALKIRRVPIPGADATKTFRTVRSADRPGSQTYLLVPLAGVNHFAPDSRKLRIETNANPTCVVLERHHLVETRLDTFAPRVGQGRTKSGNNERHTPWMNIINRLWPVSMSGSGRRRFEYFFRLREGQRNLLRPPRIINHPSTSSSTGQVGNCCFAIRTSHFKSFGKKRRLKSLSYRNSPDFCQRTRNFILFAYRKIPDKFQILDVPSCEDRLDRQINHHQHHRKTWNDNSNKLQECTGTAARSMVASVIVGGGTGPNANSQKSNNIRVPGSLSLKYSSAGLGSAATARLNFCNISPV